MEPDFNLITQQVELLKTEGIDLVFEEAAVKEIAQVAAEINQQVDNIGARRLHTVIERIVEEISFSAPDKVRFSSERSLTLQEDVVEKSLASNKAAVYLRQALGNKTYCSLKALSLSIVMSKMKDILICTHARFFTERHL